MLSLKSLNNIPIELMESTTNCRSNTKFLLNILHCTEVVHHSLDEEIEGDFTNNSSKYYYKKSEYQKIIKQKHM